ncbi:Conserved_hypothetical protein [Hexamita inflata]|uniref:Uncharacterized protein n=1 Tax=Hexamita inflata TaxID=28002 RepID=A0AA86UFW5_9EUKA|nr:Conserved hypothetical protein [Hexamita inflata]
MTPTTQEEISQQPIQQPIKEIKQEVKLQEQTLPLKLNLTKKPQKKYYHHYLYLITSNAALGSYNLQAPPQGITILDRSQFDKLQSAILTKKFLKEHQNVIVKGIFENDGTRADFLDMYNLMLDGAAGFILETQELRVVEGAIETVLVFENEKI